MVRFRRQSWCGLCVTNVTQWDVSTTVGLPFSKWNGSAVIVKYRESGCGQMLMYLTFGGWMDLVKLDTTASIYMWFEERRRTGCVRSSSTSDIRGQTVFTCHHGTVGSLKDGALSVGVTGLHRWDEIRRVDRHRDVRRDSGCKVCGCEFWD